MNQFKSIILGSLLAATSIAAFSLNANAAEVQRQHDNFNRDPIAFDNTKPLTEREIREQRARELREREIRQQRANELRDNQAREHQLREQRAHELRESQLRRQRTHEQQENREEQREHNH